jgi:Ca-activated chloride channel family protein
MLEDEQASDVITSFAELTDVDGGAVFGYGTTEGARMVEYVGSDGLFTSGSPYVFDYEAGAPAISKLDEDNLVAAADELGMPYVHREEPGGLGAMASALADAAPTVSDGARDSPHRLYWMPALGLLAVLLWQAAATVGEALATKRILGGPARQPTGAPTDAAPAAVGSVSERGAA